MLREKLETTRIQGQRDLREYRRLLNNDEKLNVFLEMKNQERPCLELTKGGNSQQVGIDQMTLKIVEEWREAMTSHCGHCNFTEIVQQYLHNLEQGYVLYGLIAQKNSEIDRLEDEIGDLEQSLEHHRSKTNQPAMSEKNQETTLPSTSRSPRKQEQEAALVTQFITKFQNILNSMELQVVLVDQGNPVFFDFPKVVEQCNLACTLLVERTMNLVASVTTTNSNPTRQLSWDNYPNVPPLDARSHSSHSSESDHSLDLSPTATKRVSS